MAGWGPCSRSASRRSPPFSELARVATELPLRDGASSRAVDQCCPRAPAGCQWVPGVVVADDDPRDRSIAAGALLERAGHQVSRRRSTGARPNWPSRSSPR